MSQQVAEIGKEEWELLHGWQPQRTAIELLIETTEKVTEHELERYELRPIGAERIQIPGQG